MPPKRTAIDIDGVFRYLRTDLRKVEKALVSCPCVGGTIMEYSDEWWRGDLSTDAGCTSGGPASHDTCGQPATFQPNSYSNDEWWGIKRAVPNGASADLVEPRAVYHRLQSLWVPPAHASMTINADATYTRSPSVTLTLACLEGHDCANMKFSNDRTNWSAPQPFAQSATWSLSSGDGAKSVFAAVEDSTGGWSGAAGDTLVLAATPPAPAALPAGGPYTASQTVVLRCSDYTSQGDFLQENLYEEWTVLPREQLRVIYLETLDHLARIYFEHEHYVPCVSMCQRILSYDPCREDVYCLLMRCYSRQGQDHLALRQYQICLKALRCELEVEPARETTQLYERIRRREHV